MRLKLVGYVIGALSLYSVLGLKIPTRLKMCWIFILKLYAFIGNCGEFVFSGERGFSNCEVGSRLELI